MVEKGSVAFLKNSKKLGCVFQDIEHQESNSIFRKDQKSFGSKAQRAILKRYHYATRNFEKERVHLKV